MQTLLEQAKAGQGNFVFEVDREALYETLDRVIAADAAGAWRQDEWLVDSVICGTSACFAGWAVILGGYTTVLKDNEHVVTGLGNPRTGDTLGVLHIAQAAMLRLGLTPEQGQELFKATNSLEDLKRLVDEYCE